MITINPAAARELLSSPEVIAALRARAEEIRDRAKALAPVDTGRLRDSIDYELDTDERGPVARISWGSGAFYGQFIEFGTRRRPARPFLRPAAE